MLVLKEVLDIGKCYFSMQVDKLKKELETQQRQKDALEAKASEAEKKIGELNLKLEKVSYLFFGILENS